MIKLRVPLIIFFFCCGLLLGADKLYASQSGVLFNFSVDNVSSDLQAGLDPRDENNQPIRTRKAVDGLTGIFQSGLFDLLTAGELYTVVTVLSSLQRSLNLAAQSFERGLPAAANILLEVFLPFTKQLQKILVCLAGLFGLCIVISKFDFRAMRYVLPPANTTTVVLRC